MHFVNDFSKPPMRHLDFPFPETITLAMKSIIYKNAWFDGKFRFSPISFDLYVMWSWYFFQKTLEMVDIFNTYFSEVSHIENFLGPFKFQKILRVILHVILQMYYMQFFLSYKVFYHSCYIAKSSIVIQFHGP